MFDRITPRDPRPASLTLRATPPVDRAKVERLRRAIAAGAYVVDSDRIATRMVETDLPG